MDPTRYKTSDWLIVVGGAVYLIGSFLDWITVDMGDLGTSSGGSAFDFFFTGIVPWLLLVGAAVVTMLLRSDRLSTAGVPWRFVLLAATVLGAVLVLIRFAAPGLGQDDDREVGRAFGLWLCSFGGVVAAAGGLLGFRRGDEPTGDRDSFHDPDAR